MMMIRFIIIFSCSSFEVENQLVESTLIFIAFLQCAKRKTNKSFHVKIITKGLVVLLPLWWCILWELIFIRCFYLRLKLNFWIKVRFMIIVFYLHLGQRKISFVQKSLACKILFEQICSHLKYKNILKLISQFQKKKYNSEPHIWRNSYCSDNFRLTIMFNFQMVRKCIMHYSLYTKSGISVAQNLL